MGRDRTETDGDLMPQIYGQVFGRKFSADQPAAEDKPTLRFCSRCKRLHPVSDFNPNRNNPDGLAKLCKTCQMQTNQRRRK